jgi:hypothetical protein
MSFTNFKNQGPVSVLAMFEAAAEGLADRRGPDQSE